METIVSAIVLLLLFSGIKIVRENQRVVVLRLGRVLGVKGPGAVFLIPLIDRAIWVDLSYTSITVPLFKPITVEDFLKEFPGAWERQDISGQIVSVVIKDSATSRDDATILKHVLTGRIN
jgi:hypothetical protein